MKGLTNDVFFDADGYNGNLMYDITAINNMPGGVPEEVLMAVWTPSKGLNMTGKHLFPNTYSDFENITIVVGTREVCQSVFLETNCGSKAITIRISNLRFKPTKTNAKATSFLLGSQQFHLQMWKPSKKYFIYIRIIERNFKYLYLNIKAYLH